MPINIFNFLATHFYPKSCVAWKIKFSYEFRHRLDKNNACGLLYLEIIGRINVRKICRSGMKNCVVEIRIFFNNLAARQSTNPTNIIPVHIKSKFEIIVATRALCRFSAIILPTTRIYFPVTIFAFFFIESLILRDNAFTLAEKLFGSLNEASQSLEKQTDRASAHFYLTFHFRVLLTNCLRE